MPVVRTPPFRRLLIADGISMFGDWFSYVGIAVLAVGQRHDEVALAFVLIAHTVPRALLAPIAGMLADRLDRRTILIAASLGRGAAALAMVIAALAGWGWVVQGCYLVRMALSAFTDAAARAALPRLVAPAQLARANAILGLSWSVMFIVGVAAGGLVTAALGVAVAFAVDALTFVIAAAGFATLPRMDRTRQLSRARVAGWGRARHAALGKVPVSIATGAAWIALNEAAAHGAGPADTAIAISAVHVARAVGSGIAPLLWPRRLRASGLGLDISTAIAIAGVAAFAVADSPVVYLLGAAVWGIGVGANWVTATTRLQAAAPDAVLGRASALDVAAQALAQCLGGVVAATIAIGLGHGPLVGWSGVVLAMVAWAAIAALGRRSAA